MIATDGVWDMLTKEKVGSIVLNSFKTNNPEDAANIIVRLAVERFQKISLEVDDITVVVVYLSKELIEEDILQFKPK